MTTPYLGRATDGWILRALIRPISARISRPLARTPVTPNQVTAVVFLLSVVCAILVAQPAYHWIALAGALFHLTSIIDCVDGELARLKNAGSPLGAKLDTIADRVGILLFMVGVLVGLWRQGFSEQVILLGGVTLGGLALATVLGYSVTYLWRHRAPQQTVAQYVNFSHYLRTHKLFFSLPLGNFLVMVTRREFISLLFMGIALVGRLDWLLWVMAIGANLAWLILAPMTLGLMRTQYETV